MIQCIICEDWYHTRHLIGSSVPNVDDYSEMICHFCTDRLSPPFLSYYKGYSVRKIKSEASGDSEKAVSVDDANKTAEIVSKADEADDSVTSTVNGDSSIGGKVDQNVSLKNEEDPSASSLVVKQDAPSEIGDCKLKSLKKLIDNEFNGASFWREGFRSMLCKCDCCVVCSGYGNLLV